MCHVIANISEDTTAVCQHSGMPVEKDYRVRELPEWECEDDKQGRRHHKSIFIHGEVVMDSVQKEVQSDTNSIVRKESAKMLDSKQKIWRKLWQSYVSMWNRNRCIIYSIKLQRKSPKSQ